MTSEDILREIALLPPEGQQQVADFVARLLERYNRSISANTSELPPLREEEFMGMWKDREDMQDSSTWVRKLRQNEW